MIVETDCDCFLRRAKIQGSLPLRGPHIHIVYTLALQYLGFTGFLEYHT